MNYVDTHRAQRFLVELRRSGNAQKAAAAASPGCAGIAPGYTTFCARKRRDASFATAWDAALAEYRAGELRKQRLALSLQEVAAS